MLDALFRNPVKNPITLVLFVFNLLRLLFLRKYLDIDHARTLGTTNLSHIVRPLVVPVIIPEIMFDMVRATPAFVKFWILYRWFGHRWVYAIQMPVQVTVVALENWLAALTCTATAVAEDDFPV